MSELVDVCLAKNQKKLLKIINENNFTNEDTVLIIRTFLYKAKRLQARVNSRKKRFDHETDDEGNIMGTDTSFINEKLSCQIRSFNLVTSKVH